jgi:hypothetical protein
MMSELSLSISLAHCLWLELRRFCKNRPRRMLLTRASLWLAGSTPLRGAIECHLAGTPANLFYLIL